MGYRIGSYVCEDCGKTTTRRMRSDRPLICVECGIQRSIQNTYRRVAYGQAIKAARARQKVHAGG